MTPTRARETQGVIFFLAGGETQHAVAMDHSAVAVAADARATDAQLAGRRHGDPVGTQHVERRAVGRDAQGAAAGGQGDVEGLGLEILVEDRLEHFGVLAFQRPACPPAAETMAALSPDGPQK